MSAQASEQLTMSRGQATPITVYLSSKHGEIVTGRTVTGYLATKKGGTAIADPNTNFTLTEDTNSPTARRRYKAVVTATVGDALIGTGAASFWAAIVVNGVVRQWLQIVVDEHAEVAP